MTDHECFGTPDHCPDCEREAVEMASAPIGTVYRQMRPGTHEVIADFVKTAKGWQQIKTMVTLSGPT